MSRRAGVERMLSRYGTKVWIQKNEENAPWLAAKAFIQPLRYKNKMYLNGSFLEAGFLDGGHYLYIGPCTHRIDQYPMDTRVRTEEQDYVVQRAEAIYVQNAPVYVWAILQKYVPEPKEDADGR